MIEALVRELRVVDIRCRVEGCSAGPGEGCMPGLVSVAAYGIQDGGGLLYHQARIDEHAALVADGWEWQEVDPHDDGARAETLAIDRSKRAG